MHCLQFVTKSIKKVNHFFSDSTKKYVLSLLLSVGKKNCQSMSDDLGIPYNSIYKYLDDFSLQEKDIKAFLLTMVNCYATEKNPGVLVVDNSQLIKRYAKNLEVLCYDYNSSHKQTTKGMSCVTSAWTNGKILIPLDFDFWIREKDLKTDKKYRKKTEISKDLISELKDKIPFKYVALDGDYGNEFFLKYLHKEKLKYSIRMPKSRVVNINGVEAQLKNQPAFKLKKNEKYKTVKGRYKGVSTYFTCQKRKGKNGTKQIVFVVSNLENLSPKGHILAYNLRWPIEKSFRTFKQKLGVQDCQSNSSKKQRAHIFATFLAFVELETQKIYKKKKSPEEVIKIIRAQRLSKINPGLAYLEGIIM